MGAAMRGRGGGEEEAAQGIHGDGVGSREGAGGVGLERLKGAGEELGTTRVLGVAGASLRSRLGGGGWSGGGWGEGWPGSELLLALFKGEAELIEGWRSKVESLNRKG